LAAVIAPETSKRAIPNPPVSNSRCIDSSLSCAFACAAARARSVRSSERALTQMRPPNTDMVTTTISAVPVAVS
jgi:hypothetical protein